MSNEAVMLFFFGILPALVLCLFVCGTGVEDFDHRDDE
jgi:hypothetical protein